MLTGSPRHATRHLKGVRLIADEFSEMGPIDYLLIEWPGRQPTGEVAPYVIDLVDRGLIRILDLAFIAKAEDDSVAALEISDLGDGGPPRLQPRCASRAASWSRADASQYKPYSPRWTQRRRRPEEEGKVMPGLLRGVARTAVVAGTATAVSNRVSRRQAERWAPASYPGSVLLEHREQVAGRVFEPGDCRAVAP
jgi:hypothetical protein